MFAVLFVMLARGGAGAPAYDTRRFAEPLVVQEQGRALVRSLRPLLRQHNITAVSVTGPDGQTRRGLGGISPVAGRALLSSMTDTRPGTDLDVLVRSPDTGARHPVSVTWTGASVTVTEGPPWDGLRPALSRSAFQQRWTLQLGSDRGADWSETDLGLLDMALSRLSPAELVLARRLVFQRVSQPLAAHNGGPASAAYVFSIEGARLLFYNLDSDAQRTIFFGTPDAPVPVEVWTILHELGHAIGRAAVHQPVLPVLPLVRRVEATRAEVQAQRVRPDAPGLGAAAGDYFVALRALEEAGFTPAEWNAHQETLGQPSDAELALAALVAGRRPVTWYAAASPGEGFAERFALWRIEPAQLRRHEPAVAEWFADGGHLTAP